VIKRQSWATLPPRKAQNGKKHSRENTRPTEERRYDHDVIINLTDEKTSPRENSEEKGKTAYEPKTSEGNSRGNIPISRKTCKGVCCGKLSPEKGRQR